MTFLPIPYNEHKIMHNEHTINTMHQKLKKANGKD